MLLNCSFLGRIRVASTAATSIAAGFPFPSRALFRYPNFPFFFVYWASCFVQGVFFGWVLHNIPEMMGYNMVSSCCFILSPVLILLISNA
ncbi:hypothetical protein LguiB_020547 [Lonicera macranthoides]